MNTKTHIAWVSNAQFSPFLRVGALRSVLGRLRFLESLGYRVSIIDFLINEEIHPYFDRELSKRGGSPVRSEAGVCRTVFQGVPYSHHVIPCEGREELFEHPARVADAMIPHLKSESVDLAITMDQGYPALFAAWKLQIPGAHFFNTRYYIENLAQHPFFVRLLRGWGVVANSHFMAEEVKKHLGLDAAVWFPSVDPDRFRFTGSPARNGKGEGAKKRIGFYAVRGIKGSPMVDRVAELLPEYQLLVVGSTGDYTMKNLNNNIRLLGFIEDMREFYNKIDLLLVPSTVKEAFSRVVIEACFNGIPVIANRVGGIPDALGNSGVQIDMVEGKEPDIPVMAQRYASEIRRLLEDTSVLEEYKKKALARAESYVLEQEKMGREFARRFIAKRS